MRFKNPANGYIEEITYAPFWCLLFGCIYFAVKGVWTHAVASFVLAVATAGISWIIYPFFATEIVRTSYLRRGWLEIEDNSRPVQFQGDPEASKRFGRSVLLLVVIILLVIVGWSVWFGKTSQTGVALQTVGTGNAQWQGPKAVQNGTNAYLLSLTSDERAQMLGRVVGDRCLGASTFYMGLGKSGIAKGNAFWSVKCRDGRSYAVEEGPDGMGRVLECSILKTMHAGECFKKLAE